MTFRFIDEHHHQWPVRLLCETLDVSPAGYQPVQVAVGRGEQVRFVFTNNGRIAEEVQFGTAQVTVPAGRTGSFTVRVRVPGWLILGCAGGAPSCPGRAAAVVTS